MHRVYNYKKIQTSKIGVITIEIEREDVDRKVGANEKHFTL